MRQISIKQLNKHLSAELKDLPFEITKNGKVIGTVVKGTDPKTKKTLKSTDIKKIVKKSTDNKGWVNPLSGSVLAPKK